MSPQIIHRYNADTDAPMSNISDILIIRPEGYASVDILCRTGDGPLRGLRLIDIEERNAQELLSLIDAEMARFDEDLPYRHLEETCSFDLLMKAILEPGQTPQRGNVEINEVNAIGDFLADHVHPEMITAIQYYRTKGELTYSLMGQTSFTVEARDFLSAISTGDGAIRAQALRSAPFFLCDIIMNEKGILDKIDAYEPLQDVMAEIARLPESAKLKAFLSFQAEIVRASENSSFWDAAKSLITPGKEDSQSNLVITTLSRLTDACRDLPLNLLRAGASHIKNITSIHSSCRQVGAMLAITQEPFHRILRRIKPNEIAAAREHFREIKANIHNPASPYSGITDYNNFLKKNLYAIAANRELAKIEGLNLAGLHETATKVLNDEPVCDDDAAALKKVLNVLNEYSPRYRLRPSDEKIKKEFSRCVSLKTIGELNTRWHHNNQRLTDVAMSGNSDIEWAPFLGETTYAGITMREITSSLGLRHQGDAENHCVGTYTQSILNCDPDQFKLIFSIENGERVLSTLEINAKVSKVISNGKAKKHLEFTMGQHFAHSNKRPCRAAERAADMLMVQLSEASLEQARAYTNAIMSDTTGLRESLVKSIQGWDANILDPELADTLGAALGPVLPKQMRDLSFLDQIDVKIPRARLEIAQDKNHEPAL